MRLVGIETTSAGALQLTLDHCELVEAARLGPLLGKEVAISSLEVEPITPPRFRDSTQHRFDEDCNDGADEFGGPEGGDYDSDYEDAP